MTKSVTSALIGIALDEQIIGSLDQTLDELLPKYRRFMTVEEKQISLRQLMDMTAGFPPDEPRRDVIWKVFQYGRDPVPLILTEGLSVAPGEVFQYSSRSSHLVSAVLQAALERANGEGFPTVLAYARAKLFDPLEIDTRRRIKSRWFCPRRCLTTRCLHSGGARMPPGCTAPAAYCGSGPRT